MVAGYAQCFPLLFELGTLIQQHCDQSVAALRRRAIVGAVRRRVRFRRPAEKTDLL